MKVGVLFLLIGVIVYYGYYVDVVREVCWVLCVMIFDDDICVFFGYVYNYVKMIV